MLDYHIRKALHQDLSVQYKTQRRNKEVLVLDELGVAGEIRADLAVIKQEYSSGFEIKSDKDTLKRLPKQVEYYSQVFDYCTLVLTKKHIDKAMPMIPQWWAVKVATEDPETGKIILDTVRKPIKNNELSSITLCTLLWKEEALQELSALGKDYGVRSKPRYRVWLRLSRSLSVEDIGNIVRNRLMTRENWR